MGIVENAARAWRIDPSETVVRRAVVGACGRMGFAVVIVYSVVRCVVGGVEAMEEGEAGVSGELMGEMWNCGRSEYELGWQRDSLRRVYHSGRPRLIRFLVSRPARSALGGSSIWVPSGEAM